MKKYLFIIAAAATCLLVACSKEKELRAPENETQTTVEHLPGWTYISANGEEDIKGTVSSNDATFSWSTGDQIAVYSGNTYHKSAGLASDYNNKKNVEFAFEGSINANRSNFAVFPASLIFDGDDVRTDIGSNVTSSALTIVLPASYSLAEVQSTTSPTPMIAANASDGSLAFKSICALLRITVKYIPKDAYTLKVTFPGKKVHGVFTLNDFVVGTDGLPVAASSGVADETITITNLGISAFTSSLIINIPVPIGKVTNDDYRYVRVGAYDSTDHMINSIDTPIKVDGTTSAPLVWNPTRLTSRMVTANLPYFTTNSKTSKKVVFASGNLVATTTTLPASSTSPIGAANNWRFAEHQYDALGDCDANRFAATGDIDLFAWIGEGASQDYEYNQYGILHPGASPIQTFAGYLNPDNLKCNFGDIFNGDTYPANTWRLLNNNLEGGETSSESARLLTRTTTSGYVVTKATILQENGTDTLIRGAIIFPDTYTHPYGFKEIKYTARCDRTITQEYPSGSGHYGSKNCHWKNNVITLAEWDILEKQGCVFLPMTSVRAWIKESGVYKIDTDDYFGECGYWTGYGTTTYVANTNPKEPTATNNNAGAIIVSDEYYCTKTLGDGKTGITPGKSSDRRRGHAVRLIRDVN